MVRNKRLLKSIRVQNLLSFGARSAQLELRALNVLIGPNGSGKSNLIEALTLLQAAPRDLLDPIQAGGGINEWLWKGADQTPIAEIESILENSVSKNSPLLRHRLSLTMVGQRAQLVDESIENEHPRPGESDAYFYYRYQRGRPVLNVKSERDSDGSKRDLRRDDLPLDQSVLSQRKDPDLYPEVTWLGNQYAKLKVFRELNLGRSTAPRKPQATDLASDFLREDAANLALVLNDLEHRSGLRRGLVEKLKDADASIEDFSTKVQGGTIQLFLHYSGLASPVPATRLSDGTIRYLCLLAILCHPTPPPLVCIEEPELGLHPDLLAGVADLLIDASQRMQLIVTTHSDTLVDGLTKVPETVVVCEKTQGSTEMCRKSGAELSTWLESYGLGQLWRKGEIGGNRW